MGAPPKIHRRLSRSRAKAAVEAHRDVDATVPPLTGVTLDPNDYSSDFALLDRFQQFSAELARLGLGGVAAIGVLVPLVLDKTPIKSALFEPRTSIALLVSLTAFVAAAGAALFHRFLSTDGMFFHLSSLKRKMVHDAMSATDARDRLAARLRDDEDRRERAFKLSERMIFASAGLLVVGAAAFALALVTLFFRSHP